MRRLLSLVLVALVVTFALITFSRWQNARDKAPPAHFVIENRDGGDACTGLEAHCVRVLCAVSNTGGTAGSLHISATITPELGSATTKTVPQTLRPGETKVVVFDFPDSKPETKYTYLCSGKAGS